MPKTAPLDFRDPRTGELLPAWRWPVAVGAWVIAVIAFMAATVGLIDLFSEASEVGSRLLWAGLGMGTGMLFITAFARPGAPQDWRRLFVLSVGIWPFALFAFFLVWRIGLSGEQLAACETGDTDACVTLALRKLEREKLDDARELLEIACEREHPEGCHYLGALLADEAGDSGSLARAAEAHRVGCEGGVVLSCTRLGRWMRSGRLEATPEEARFYLSRACELDDANACAELDILSSETGPP